MGRLPHEPSRETRRHHGADFHHHSWDDDHLSSICTRQRRASDVTGVDFDEVEYKEVYDPNSSLKLSMGLPPVETARGRIDLIFDIAAGKVAPTSQPAEEFFYKAYNISYWTMPQEDAAKWLNSQFGTNIE